MEKGLLHKKVFLLKSPGLHKEVDLFIQEVRERMDKYKVKKYIPLKKMLGDDKMELCIIPCSDTPGGQDPNLEKFIAEGFVIDEQINLSNVAATSKTFEFEKNVSFGVPKSRQADKPKEEI